MSQIIKAEFFGYENRFHSVDMKSRSNPFTEPKRIDNHILKFEIEIQVKNPDCVKEIENKLNGLVL